MPSGLPVTASDVVDCLNDNGQSDLAACFEQDFQAALALPSKGFGSFAERLSYARYLRECANAQKAEITSVDAFGRQRVSETGNRLDSEFIYDKQVDLFDEEVNNGLVTHNADSRDLTLSISDALDGTFSRISSYPVPYTPGNSQLIDITGVLNLAGIPGVTVECFLRSSVTGSLTDQTVEEADWLNEIPGLDFSKSQIFVIDFQSLKVGSIRYFINTGGSSVLMAKIDNDNLRDSGYWQSPSLPVFWKIYNSGGTTFMEIGYGDENNAVGFRAKVAANDSATMKAICCTVKSEGGEELLSMPGLPRSIDMGITPKIVSTTLVPILSIRQKSVFNSFDNLSVAIIDSLGLQVDESIRYVVISGGTLTGEAFSDVNPASSSVEFDVAATSIAGGTAVISGYLYATSTGPAASRIKASSGESLGKLILWNRKSSETGILTIAAIRSGSSDSNVLASLSWKEVR